MYLLFFINNIIIYAERKDADYDKVFSRRFFA